MGRVKESFYEFCCFLCEGTNDDPCDMFDEWMNGTEQQYHSMCNLWEFWIETDRGKP
jgi:hypothetical protein